MVNPDKIAIAIPENDVDKIYYAVRDSRTVPGSNPSVDPPTEYVIPHGKGEIFDAEMIISLDGIKWYPAEFPPFAYNATYALYLPLMAGGLYVDSSNVHVFLQATQTNKNIQFSIVGFQ